MHTCINVYISTDFNFTRNINAHTLKNKQQNLPMKIVQI